MHELIYCVTIFISYKTKKMTNFLHMLYTRFDLQPNQQQSFWNDAIKHGLLLITVQHSLR